MPWDMLETLPLPSTGVDPSFWWALFEGGHHDFQPEGIDDPRVPVLFRLSADVSAAELGSRVAALPSEYQDLVRPFVGRAERVGEPGQPFHVGFFNWSRLRSLLRPDFEPAKSFTDLFSVFIPGPPLPASLVRQQPQPLSRKPEATDTTSRTVVVGIIDDGLAFGHPRFRLAPDKTRFDALWIQDGAFDVAASVDYGREILAPEIDARLAQSSDDEQFYTLVGVPDFTSSGHKPLEQRIAHGTHVLDGAFGLDLDEAYDPNEGDSSGTKHDWRIVGVQLPTSTVEDSSGALFSPYVVDAVKYIERIARETRPDAPVVVVVSYGFTAGPHDGTHPIERGIHDVVSMRNKLGLGKMRVVIPSGNSHLDRLHARAFFPKPIEEEPDPPATAELRWRLQPDDTTPSFVEIWLSGAYDPAGRLAISIKPPDEAASPDLVEGSNKVLTLKREGEILCQAFFRADPFSNRAMFLIALQPTARHEAVAPTVPPGLWTIRLTSLGFGEDAIVEAWIQRDHAPFGYPAKGRQSYFDHPDYRRFDASGREEERDVGPSLVQRGGSTNAMATGKTPIVVGGLVRKELKPAKYSAGGPDPFNVQIGPSALVTSDDSLVHGGVIAAGTRSGTWAALNGTSVAGPRIARWMAREMEGGRSGSRAAVENFAATAEGSLPAPPPSPERGGVGRIRLSPDGSHPRDARFDVD